MFFFFFFRELSIGLLTPSVVCFFIRKNVDYQDPNHVQQMREARCMETMAPFWYAGSEEYDKLCQNFQEAIRTVGRKHQSLDDDKWNKNVDGKMAQIILLDQLSRNCFRGMDEAFAYDDLALNVAREISTELMSSSESKKNIEEIELSSLQGEVYPPYLHFTLSPLMHSEKIEDHELALDFVEFSLNHVPTDLQKHFENAKEFELDHKRVIEKFGRYPHRNKMKGRESTKEELEWLASDDVPRWAKSQ